MRRTAENWQAAVTALRGGSATQILALRHAGAISVGEVFDAAWRVCQNDPVLRAELGRQFRADTDEYVRTWVGDGLEEAAASLAARRSGDSTPAEPAAAPPPATE